MFEIVSAATRLAAERTRIFPAARPSPVELGRADIRLQVDEAGELYILRKSDGMIRYIVEAVGDADFNNDQHGRRRRLPHLAAEPGSHRPNPNARATPTATASSAPDLHFGRQQYHAARAAERRRAGAGGGSSGADGARRPRAPTTVTERGRRRRPRAEGGSPCVALRFKPPALPVDSEARGVHRQSRWLLFNRQLAAQTCLAELAVDQPPQPARVGVLQLRRQRRLREISGSTPAA